MKIAQIIPRFMLGGAETMCENLTAALDTIGQEVIAVSLWDYDSPIVERLKERGIRVVFLNKKRGIDPAMVIRLVRLFREFKPDVVHSHINTIQYAVPAAMIAKVPVRVHTMHTLAENENVTWIRKFSRLAYHCFHAVPVALTDITRESVVREYGLAASAIPVIGNGIPLERCLVKESYEAGQVFRFLHIGRFVDVKNHMGLLESFALFHEQVPESELILVGDGELRPEIEETIQKKGLAHAVKLMGTQGNVHPFLHDADVFVLPSKYEGFPMTIIEAMATGLPVIASDVGGIPDVLSNEINGLLVEAEPEKIAEAMKRLYEDRSLRETIGKQAKADSEKYSAVNMAKKYVSLYSRLKKRKERR